MLIGCVSLSCLRIERACRSCVFVAADNNLDDGSVKSLVAQLKVLKKLEKVVLYGTCYTI